MDIILNVLNQTLVFTIPLLVVALGGMFSERSGVVNIALEGIMIGGAFVGVYFIYLMQSANTSMNPQVLLILALIVAGIFGMLLSLLHAFAAINLKADQTISGTAINMLAPGLGLFLAKLIFNGNSSVPFSNTFRIHEIPVLSQIPILGPILVNLMTGTMVVEKICSVPGLGKLLINSILSNDYNIILACSFLYAAMYIFMMLIIDISYGIIDPRIRLGKDD